MAHFKPAGTGVAGVSRGFSRPTPIAIWSSKIAKLDPAQNAVETLARMATPRRS
jgi:hypothetical protein